MVIVDLGNGFGAVIEEVEDPPFNYSQIFFLSEEDLKRQERQIVRLQQSTEQGSGQEHGHD